jgi:glucose 1-dehydrogenase
LAEEFAVEDAHAHRTDEDGADETRRRVHARGRKAMVRRLDVQDEASLASPFKAADDHLGTPDILIDSAGLGGTRRCGHGHEWVRSGDQNRSMVLLLLP